MPLKKGGSRETISENISELTHHGSRPRSRKQIVAIALSQARKTGGGAKSAAGPAPNPRMEPPPAHEGQSSQERHHDPERVGAERKGGTHMDSQHHSNPRIFPPRPAMGVPHGSPGAVLRGATPAGHKGKLGRY